MRSCLYNLKRAHASKLIGLIGTAGGLPILLAFPIGKSEPATPTIKVPVNPQGLLAVCCHSSSRRNARARGSVSLRKLARAWDESV